MSREKTPNVHSGATPGSPPSVRKAAFELLKAELTLAFAAPDSAYEPLDADTIICRNAR